ncbi:hypothetical protein [Diaphorobacter caeni]|uniref:hypothetical protein n=1 Tax=Diaphorobacter caeni TaxID=2784387 RepID=UPI00189055EC|nr:hypothetical protein [Diaphorobacter caeni]MBF5005888.1 hypothetical protein [Diaphorobacter caeni]
MTTIAACTSARQVLSAQRERLRDDAALQLAVTGCIEVERSGFPEQSIFDAALHCEDCAQCQAWAGALLDELNPERVTRRGRVARYCCLSMFDAVTSLDARVRFSFELFRYEDPCWCINGEYVFARHCPWCGTRLPDGAFEEDGAPPSD